MTCMGVIMRRFDQGSMRSVGQSVQPRLDESEKVGRPETRMDRASVQPPNLVQPFRAHVRVCAHTHVRTHARTHARTRAHPPAYTLDEVRRLDGSSVGAGFSRPTFRPTSDQVGRNG